jgi:hypothetical protein
MKILAGVYPCGEYEGDIKLNGEVINFTGDSIRQAIKHGICYCLSGTCPGSANDGRGKYFFRSRTNDQNGN